LNESRVRQILEIEHQAQAIYDAAVREAEQLPVQAEKEAAALVEKAQADAEAEAQQLVAHAGAEECSTILAQAEEEAKRMEALAMGHFDHAVNYVLDQVVGRK
jgi:vacuolar-type H+-ATPase subunit H